MGKGASIVNFLGLCWDEGRMHARRRRIRRETWDGIVFSLVWLREKGRKEKLARKCGSSYLIFSTFLSIYVEKNGKIN